MIAFCKNIDIWYRYITDHIILKNEYLNFFAEISNFFKNIFGNRANIGLQEHSISHVPKLISFQ